MLYDVNVYYFRRGRSCYYATPADPHDAQYLWHDIFYQLENQGLGAAAAIRRIGFPETASKSRQVIEVLRRSSPLVYLTMEDYHRATDSGLSTFLENLVKAERPEFHIALISRTRPDMNLGELRIKGLTEVTAKKTRPLAYGQTGDGQPG